MLATGSLRKHPFLLALRRWGRFARRNVVSPRETSPAAKSEEKRMFSQARPREKQVDEPEAVKAVQSRFLVGFWNLLLHRNSLELLWHALFMITIVITFENVTGT